HFSSHKVSLVFSSMNKTLINKLLEKIFQQEQLQIAELILRPEYVEKEIFPELSHKTQFLCISPIVLASPEKSSFYAKHFVSPSIELFSQLLYEATIERMKSCKFYTESDFNENISFKFVPDNAYLEKIKNQDKKFARIYGIQDYTQRYEIRGYTLPFTLEASPLIQNFVINCGIGAYGYRGYGMLDLVEHQQTQRITLTNWQMALSD
ncbi:MAG: CRISPR-associated endoribonuclease Cas6, partial [Thermonemataceae bacterium]|nr:CRISPR-associated endoribonuclease Cas6 [Thermonemataceae bacterium]